MNDPSNTSIWLHWWPGLPGIWRHGDRAALILAILFALALNVSIASYGIWPHLMPEPVRMVWTVLVATIWGLSLSRLNKDARIACPVAEKEWDRGLFIDAQGEYLRGHWFEAESLLVGCLGVEPRDDAARLLLASVYRRAGDLEKATEQLDLVRDHRAWQWELRQERLQVKKSIEQAPNQSDEAVQHEVKHDEAAQPEAAQPEASQAEASQPEASQAEASQAEASQPEVSQAEASQAEASQAEAVGHEIIEDESPASGGESSRRAA